MPRRNIPVPVPDGSKYCFHCASCLPKQRFYVDRRTLDGRRYACIACTDRKARHAATHKRHLNALYLRLTDPI